MYLRCARKIGAWRTPAVFRQHISCQKPISQARRRFRQCKGCNHDARGSTHILRKGIAEVGEQLHLQNLRLIQVYGNDDQCD